MLHTKQRHAMGRLSFVVAWAVSDRDLIVVADCADSAFHGQLTVMTGVTAGMFLQATKSCAPMCRRPER